MKGVDLFFLPILLSLFPIQFIPYDNPSTVHPCCKLTYQHRGEEGEGENKPSARQDHCGHMAVGSRCCYHLVGRYMKRGDCVLMSRLFKKSLQSYQYDIFITSYYPQEILKLLKNTFT